LARGVGGWETLRTFLDFCHTKHESVAYGEKIVKIYFCRPSVGGTSVGCLGDDHLGFYQLRPPKIFWPLLAIIIHRFTWVEGGCNKEVKATRILLDGK
jgi:hypothetical protein